jgi:phage terminase large subunit-like protein
MLQTVAQSTVPETRALKERFALLLAEKQRRLNQRMFDRLFPAVDTIQPDGSTYHARDKYPRHMEFFEAGARYRERCLMAANRVGKTVAGAYEVACHLTGDYPDWWPGRRFPGPVRAWAAGKTNETTRDIVQSTLMGEVSTSGGRKTVSGTGMIPGRLIGAVTSKAGVTDMLDTVRVKHVKGGSSILGFKSYQQGRGSFEGTAQHVVWLDEEPPIDIYGECLTRTATTGGILVLTFTPLDGLSETVMQFMPGEKPGG